MKKVFLLLFTVTLAFAGCSKKNDTTQAAPTTTGSTTGNTDNSRPTACFVTPGLFEMIDGSVTVNFSCGCSQLAYFYDWDYGDGSTHDVSSSVSHTYTKAGKYKVVLTVWNKNKTVSSTATNTITVGERYLTKITINSIDPIDQSTGYAWDHSATGGIINGVSDTTGPDLFLKMGYDTAMDYVFSTDTFDVVGVYDNVITDASGAIKGTPVTWDFTKSSSNFFRNIKLTNKKWVVQIMDKTYAPGGGGGSRSIGSSIGFNPIITLGSTSPSTYPLTGKWKITFEWVIR